MGRSLVGATRGAPSYDGQFAPVVQSISDNALAQAKGMSGRLGDLGGQLEGKASAFEAADNSSASTYRSLNPIDFWRDIYDESWLISILPWIISVPSVISILRILDLGQIANYVTNSDAFIWNAGKHDNFSSFIGGRYDLFKGREQKVWPERRGRPREQKKQPELKVAVWEDSVWGDEATGQGKWGKLRTGYKAEVDTVKGEAGLGAKDGIYGGYAEVTAIEAETSGVIGDTNLGLAGGIGAVAGRAEAFAGYKDGTVGAKVGGSIVSAEATVGANVAGWNVGAVGGIGLEFELGISLGKKTRIDLGPFTIGLNIGEALGS